LPKKVKKSLQRIVTPVITGVLISTAMPIYGQTPIENRETSNPKSNYTQILDKKEKSLFSPKINIDIKNPRTDAEANTKLKNTLISLYGESLCWVSQKSGASDSLALRLVEAGLILPVRKGLETLSHEYGHYRVGEEHGAINPKVHFNLFSRSKYTYDGLKKDSLDARLKITEGGPNQDSLNSFSLFKESQLGDSKFYQDIDKLLIMRSQFGYIAKSKGGMEDYANIVERLNEKGFNVSLEQMKKNNLWINLLSFDNWKSLYNIGKFVVTGERESKPTYFKINDSLELGLPGLAHYFTTKGEAVEISEFLKLKGKTLEINVFKDLDSTQKRAGLNNLRIGGQLYNLGVGNNFSLSPYFHANLKGKGHDMGTEYKIKLSNKLGITGEVGYTNNDLFAKDILDKDEGVYGRIGLTYEF